MPLLLLDCTPSKIPGLMSSNAKSGEVFTGGATTSQHIEAQDDDHFQNTTFKLKRTRSLGLLDEFIDPEKQQEQIEKKNNSSTDSELPLSQIDGSADHGDSEVHEDSSTHGDSTTHGESSSAAPSLPYITSPDLIPHDDTDLVAEPSRHVDYLSHEWDVSDISKSWRYVIQRRKDVANAARLENASWRTWAQRRSNLKTISPEEVNWSKESDVTWLYGPIVDDDENDHETCASNEDSKSGTATSIVAGDISIARKNHGPKPILKKRTVQDMMISHLNLLKLQVATARAELEQRRREDAEAEARREAAAKSGKSDRPPEYFDYDVISAKLNSQYKNYSGPGSLANSNNNSALDLTQAHSPVEATNLSSKLQKVSSERLATVESTEPPKKEKRHIHFNDEVKQCIAVNEYSDEDEDYDYDDEYDNDYDYGDDESYVYEDNSNFNDEDEDDDYDDDEDEDDEEDEGGFFLKVKPPSSASLAGLTLPGLSSASTKDKDHERSEESDSISTNNSKVYKTIHLLPPTTLNYGSSDEESDDYNPYTSSLSHNVDNSTSRGYDYYYDYNTVYQVDPNHAIYGSKKTPDVVDVPKNITLGSNFDYEIIQNEDAQQYENTPLHSAKNESSAVDSDESSKDSSKLPVSSLEDSASPLIRPNPFSLHEQDQSDSDSDSEDDGLSINARNSSQSLAQLVFGHALTSADSDLKSTPAEHYYPKAETKPSEDHISSINPRYSSTSVSRQPHSSSSLSDQFLNTGMTKASNDTSLSDTFFNIKAPEAKTASSLSLTERQSPPVQKKASPLPPHTTSANAFLGTSTPPPLGLAPKKGFMFDSDSDSEDEFIENASPPPSGDKNTTSYASLYQVADRNGISVPSQPEGEESSQKNRVGLAMVNFLGGWNKSG